MDNNPTPLRFPFANINGIDLHVPPLLDGILPPCTGTLRFDYEALAWLGLEAVLQTGMTFYDLGCAWGVFSALAARRVGEGGKVTAFDANPQMLEAAHALVESNGLSSQVRFVHACVGESSEGTVDFFIPAEQLAAAARRPALEQAYTHLQKLRVPLLALDDDPSTQANPPDCIKIDIEGSEYAALCGMQRLLSQYHPYLVIETHHRDIEQVRGSLAELCAMLESLSYALFDLSQGQPVTGSLYASRHAEHIAYLLAVPQTMLDEDKLTSAHQRLQAEILQRAAEHARLGEAQRCSEQGQTQQAIALLEDILARYPDQPQAHYLLGYCYAAQNALERAAIHFEAALNGGYDAGRVLAERGMLRYRQNDLDAACTDLQRAAALHPADENLQRASAALHLEQLNRQMAQVREQVERAEWQAALEALPALLDTALCGEAHYLSAFCLQQLQKTPRIALQHYHNALQNHFDEYWVRLNRAELLERLGDRGAALADLECAARLRPDDPLAPQQVTRLTGEIYGLPLLSENTQP